MASSEIVKALENVLRASATEFFSTTDQLSAYKVGQSMTSGSSETLSVSFASVIGYAGDEIKGSLVTVCEGELLNKSHPNHAMGMPVGEAEVLDWVGEVANQLLGRIKNKLASAGVKFAMGTPTTVTGKSMQITSPKDGFVIPLIFNGPFGAFRLYLLSVADPKLKIAPGAEVGNSGMAEGGSILF